MTEECLLRKLKGPVTKLPRKAIMPIMQMLVFVMAQLHTVDNTLVNRALQIGLKTVRLPQEVIYICGKKCQHGHSQKIFKWRISVSYLANNCDLVLLNFFFPLFFHVSIRSPPFLPFLPSSISHVPLQPAVAILIQSHLDTTEGLLDSRPSYFTA